MNFFLDKYFWIVFILYSFYMVSAPKSLLAGWEKNDKIMDEYKALRKNILMFMNLPWLIMGIGIISGSVSSMFEYLLPAKGNPFITLFFISAALLWAVSLYWVFMLNGAEKAARFQIFRFNSFGKRSELTPDSIKLTIVLMVLAGIFATIMIFTNNVSLTAFHR